MTPTEFKAGLAFLDEIAPHYLSQCGLVTDGVIKDEGLRFWRDELAPFPVAAFKEGCKQAAKQSSVFPNFADILKFTREFAATALKPSEMILIADTATERRKTEGYYENAIWVQPRLSRDAVEDKIDEQLRMLSSLGFIATKIDRHEGVYRRDPGRTDNYDLPSDTQEGAQLYSAVMSYVGTSKSNWDALAKVHNVNYEGTKQHAQVREDFKKDPNSVIADAFARMRSRLGLSH